MKTVLGKIISLIFGILLAIILFEIALSVSGFLIIHYRDLQNRVRFKKGASCTILCFGDSVTARQYPEYLQEELKKIMPDINFNIIDKGLEATDSDYIVLTLKTNLDKYKPDLVTIMTGNNDGGLSLNHAPYGNNINKSFIKSLRVYKFIELLKNEVVNKINEVKIKRYLKNSKANNDKNRLFSENENINLAKLYISKKDYKKAEELFKKEISEHPDNMDAYSDLAYNIYVFQKMGPQAIETAEKSIKFIPYACAYSCLGNIYEIYGETEKAELAYLTAMKANPEDPWAYICYFNNYKGKDKVEKLKDILKKPKLSQKLNDRLIGAIAIQYQKDKKYELMEEYFKKADEFRAILGNEKTYKNYHAIYNELKPRGIKLACVQYPIRSIEPLKRIFPENKEIIFISNEKLFKEALKTGTYETFFRDQFSGDFGHCTEKGNKMITANIADVLAREIFKR